MLSRQKSTKVLKRLCAALLTVALAVSPSSFQVFASTTPKPVTPDGIAKYELAKQTEIESILLLKNNLRRDGSKKMLPLNENADKIAIFGRGQTNNIAGSGGSGTVQGAFSYTFIEGLNELPVSAAMFQTVATSGSWSQATEYPGKWGVAQQSGTGWNMTSPIQTPEGKYSDATVATAAETAKTAVVFLIRSVGTEEMDRASNPPQPSDWYLNPSELTLLAQVTSNFDDVILVVSTSGLIDMTWTNFEWMRQGSTDYYSTNGMYNGPKTADASVNANKLKAIVWSYGGGGHYGLALARLLYGKESFSAKLADTIAYDWYDYFTSKNFGGQQTYGNNGAGLSFGNGADMGTLNGVSDPVTIYQEYVYSGHRYFDTFMGGLSAERDPVMFPFGFGLTYADFNFSDMSLSYGSDKVTVNAKITNMAGLAGKEVMEVYVSPPNDKSLDQPYQKLVGYAKTAKLSEGGSQAMSVDVPIYYFASYDESKAAYVLEEGDYIVRVGNSSRNTSVAGVIRVSNGGKPITVEQLASRMSLNQAGGSGNQASFDGARLNSKTTTAVTLKRWDGTSVTLPVSSLKGAASGGNTVIISEAQVSTVNNAAAVPDYVGGTAPKDKTYTLQAVKDGLISVKDFVAQMTTDELVALLTGGVNTGPAQTYPDDTAISLMNTANALSKPGTANSRVTGAGSSRGIQRLGIPSVTYADGSAGISISANIAANLETDRNPGYARAAGMACTWNPELQYEWGVSIGKEMTAINVDIWLAPSINLHRNPLNGRNTEYYSEDPFLSGMIASNAAKGVAAQGVTVCLKHFAGNDQEQYRRGFHTPASVAAGTSKDAINSITSERALREVTLRPFEMAVKTGAVRTVMSAFNKINGQFCAASKDLLINILRGEWGFNGFVVTDWGDFDEIANAADEMRFGNDMIMSGTHSRYSIPNQIRNGLNGIADYDSVPTDPPKGAVHPVTRNDLERNAVNVMNTILSSRLAFNAQGRYNTDVLGRTVYHVVRSLSIQTTKLPDAIAGMDYKLLKVTPLLATGSEGTTSYTFSVDADSKSGLPQGMTLSGDGTLSGSPVNGSDGSYSITFKVTDSRGASATKTLELNVAKSIKIMTPALNDFRVGIPFDQTIEVISTGQSGLSFSVIGALPTGIVLNPVTGRLSGTLSKGDIGKTFNFVIRAASGETYDQLACSAIIKDYIDLTEPEGDEMTIMVGSSAALIWLAATRNVAGDSFNFVVKGNLPPGMMFIDSMGLLYGSPDVAGEFPLEITVSLESDPAISITKDFVIKGVSDPDPTMPKFITDSLPFGKSGVMYAAQIITSGGSGAKSFEIVSEQSSAKLPTGLSVSSTGVISCVPGLFDSGVYKLAVKHTSGDVSVVKVFDLYISGVLTASPAAGTVFNAGEGLAFSRTISVSGGFSGDYTYALQSGVGTGLPQGITLTDNGDYTATISGTPKPGFAGTYDFAVYVNETFAGSPVDTVLYYKITIDDTHAVIKNESGNASASFRLVNADSGKTDFICVLAIYGRDGKLAQNRSEIVSVEGGTASECVLSADLPSGFTAKAFIWDKNYVPLCDAAAISG